MSKKLVNYVNATTAEVYMYGLIGRYMDVDTTYLIRELEAMKAQGVKAINFYVNSDGGDVVQGQALFAYLNRNEFQVTYIVDGIAASMMAMILTNPKHKVVANKYSKFMYHRVSGIAEGNSEDMRSYADLMEKFEDDLVDMFANKTGLDKKKVKKEYFSNTDKWLTAQEALDLKLVDEIQEGRKGVVEPATIASTREAVVYYTNQLNNCLINSLKMKNILKILNLPEDAKDDAVEAAITNVLNRQQQIMAESAEKDRQLADLKNQIAGVKKAQVKAMIDKAIAEKKFGEDMRDEFTAMATENYERAEKVINAMSGVAPVVGQLNQASVPDTEKTWGYDEYFKANKLENLKKNNPERFKELYKSKFNREYKD